MAVAVSGNLCTCLFRYLVLGFLAFAFFYTTGSLLFPDLSSEDLRKNAAGLIQRGAGAAGVSAGSLSWIDAQYPTFETESIHYSKQKMAIQPVNRQGLQQNTSNQHLVDEDFYLSKVYSTAMQPSKVIPYYFRAEGVFDKEEVTITTLITENRFEVFTKLVRNYRGPISVSIWIRDDEFKDQHFQALHDLYGSEPLLKQYVDVHVVVDRFDFQLNMWRNVARLFARTDYFMLLDVDFHICTNLRKHLQENPYARQLLREGSALILPAFEFTHEEDGVDSATFPVEKQAVEKLVADKNLMAFHSAKFVPGHGATDYPKWFKTDEIYRVTEFNYKYEPYVILKKEGTPYCDERFVGYGANKAACLYEIYISGIDYYVLPKDFLIHQSHAYLESKRSGGRKLNGELYTAFRDELCFRYARAMYFANELDTRKAANMKSQCSNLKGFKAALEAFPQMWPTTAPLTSLPAGSPSTTTPKRRRT
ncbi:glycosyl-transferase for dystroglycan-domain-containing protein [Gamsiella multidivaricata]|uniref:glycosyl-transferase for dystroglycan-domain-containing protein n=1 Tax=Gamsiella multidivaricata TaxID=101098 RepID=UPI00221E95DF|nr:glycosyl-transferase for dystroglycan-domain-containing protein [Gamsiella multidivaricata]KAG0368005.1 hypothetical protein BGZ54_002861 [Gamsiella multidivaricata]KAI7822727.1 glycosyl-transferase for dystroglycan-domain-containing protein [Gamsiella multidivaricata]